MKPSIEDRFAIQDLLYRYARANDERDAAALADCFAPGQFWVTGPGFEVRDATQSIGALSTLFEWTLHKVHNHEYAIEGSTGRGYCYCVATHVKQEAGRRVKIDWHIRYEDELRCIDGAWRFTKRHLNVGLIETLPLNE